jgi:hypothetical protein
MQKTAGTLLQSRNGKVGYMLQLQLRKKSLKEREPELLLKNKSNAERFILFQLSPVLSPNQKKIGQMKKIITTANSEISYSPKKIDLLFRPCFFAQLFLLLFSLLEICNFGTLSHSPGCPKKVQEDPSTPLQKPREEVEDPGREVGPTGK